MKEVRFVIFVYIFAAASAISQVQWNLDRCLEVARERSPHLKAAGNLLRSSALSLSELNASAFPQVKLAGSSLFTPAAGRLLYDPIVTNGGELGAQFVVEQSLYDGGMRSLRAEQLSIESAERGKEYRMTERDLTYAVRLAFIESLRSRAEEELQRTSVGQLSDYLELVNSMLKGGGASYTDALKTEIQLGSARTSLQRASEATRVASYSLTELIGVSSDTTIDADGALDSLNVLPGADTSAYAKTPSETLELSLAAMDIARSDYDVEMARSERHPVVSLVGDAGLLTSGDNLRLSPTGRSPILGYSFGLAVELPIFNWGATSFRIEQRELASDNLRLEATALKRSIDVEWKRVRLQMQNARGRLAEATKTAGLAEENFLLTKSKFAGGGSLSIEVLSAQQLLTDSRLNELQARAEILDLEARIERLRTQ